MIPPARWYGRLLGRWLLLRREVALLLAAAALAPLVAPAAGREVARAVAEGAGLVLVLVLFAGVWRGGEEQVLRRWFAGMGVGAPRLFAVAVLVRAGLLSAALGCASGLAGVVGILSPRVPVTLAVAASLTAGLQLAALAAVASLFLDGAANSLAVVGIQLTALGVWISRIGEGRAGGLERVAAGVLSPFLWDVKGLSWQVAGYRLLAAATLFGVSLGWLLLSRPGRPRAVEGPSGAPLLEVASLRVCYPSSGWRRHRVEVVHGIDLTLETGKIVGLLGPNGAGKTSTFNGILGLVMSEGTLTWAPGRARRLAAVPENDFLPRVVRARHVLRAGGISREDARLGEFARALEVGGLLDTPLGRLSRGQRRRVHVLLGMLPEADVFLVDEPAQGVDPLERRGVKELLRRVAGRGAAVVVATHQLREFEELVDAVALMDRGRLVAQGSVAELRERFVILQVSGEGTGGAAGAAGVRRVGVAVSLADRAEQELMSRGAAVSRREPTLEELFELEVRRAREDGAGGDGRDPRGGLGLELGGAWRGADRSALGGEATLE